MPRRNSLTYADAVRMLDDESPFVRDLDALIGHALDAIPGGKLLALPYFAFRSKLVAYGNRVVGGIRDRVDGLGRHDRTQRLRAAHTVVAVTAFAEAVGETLDGAGLRVEHAPGPGKALVPAESHGALILRLRDLAVADLWPLPPGSRGAETLRPFYESSAVELATLLRAWGVPLGEDGAFSGSLVRLALRRYAELYRRLMAEVPEFGVWAYLAEHAATRAEVGETGEELRAVHTDVMALRGDLGALRTGLAGIPALLAEVPGRAAANRVRTELARAYAAALTRSVLGGTRAPDGVALPTLERGYVNPAARAAVSTESSDRMSEDGWWAEQPRHDDVAALLVGSLTAADATDGPLVILGQPGAGKSVLTRMLAARLSGRGFLPVRVELRNVPADADVQTQVEHAVRATIGRSVEWPDLADAAHADGLLPLVILDGFDELLQATGVNRSDYLEKVAAFQRDGHDLGRPLAAVVTSRTAVADRMRFPSGGTALRLEPFDPSRVATWLGVWNAENAASLRARGVAPLDAASVLAYGELAEQPLLLIMLALYDAENGALRAAGADLGRAGLYDRLLTEFARREVRKDGVARDEAENRQAVAAEMRRLEVVALALFNRHAKTITGADLDRDLATLLPAEAPPPDPPSLAKPLTAAQLAVGRFFFVHESRAVRDDDAEHAYEFLHATFGEFLVARYVVETLRTLARDRAYFRETGRPGSVDDGPLWAALSFAALAGSAATIEFTEGLLRSLTDDTRTAVRELAVELLLDAPYEQPHRSLGSYRPDPRPVYERHAYYSANLTTIAVLSTGEPLDFHPVDTDTWPSALWHDEFDGLRAVIRVVNAPGEDEYDMRVTREDGGPVGESTIRQRAYGVPLDPPAMVFGGRDFPADGEAGELIRRSAYFHHDWDLSLAALIPYLEFVGTGVVDLALDAGTWVPLARGLLELRLAPPSPAEAPRRIALYKWCLDGHPDTRFLDVLFRQLREDLRVLGPAVVAEVVEYAGISGDEEDLEAYQDVLRALDERPETSPSAGD